jgi:hypothetical protein
MIVVETTGVAEGFRASKLSFEEAVTSATRRLEETRWGAAVDVGAARHPYGDITPMDSPYDAEVARAYDEALTLAKAKRRELEEMAHLLYGLLAAKGKLTVKLCQQMGVQLDIVLRRLADALPVGDCPHAPFPTRNSRECQRMADDLAWHGGSPSVREQDLLWALLLKSPDSRSLQDTAAAVGLDLTTLASALSRIHPRPGAFASSMPLSSKK